MRPSLAEADPKGLIRESFRIPGITAGECRSIFLDWALSLPEGVPPGAAVAVLLERYAPKARGAAEREAHPMVAVLTAAAVPPQARPSRRGGSRARREGPGEGPGETPGEAPDGR